MTIRKRLGRLAGLLILTAVLGCALWSLFSKTNWFNADYLVGITAFSIGVVTFFGVSALNPSVRDEDVLSSRRLRTPIASSLIMSYLFIVCFTTFVGNALVVGDVTKEFVKSFSSVITITIVFYFGASAAVQIFARERGGPSDRQDREHQKKENDSGLSESPSPARSE